ncbi:hypothetical protein [Streptomyces sp. CB02261]|uniref:hypothetical protein n=1 Tax=Streptomyces sp. CB02261 TaxID=1703940 RepID=UPI0009388F56|nr:hypothetical protein [Streptomyces sp. CB02261]OKJ52562.1 hypothetical protein AMK29_30530 [Streptomyces sp. CB02261]
MSEWGIALIAAGSAILGSIVTGFFAWKAGHRQAAAAEAAGQAQAAALISTVQATLDEQRRTRADERRRQVYADMLTAVTDLQRHRDDHDALTRALRAHDLVVLEGPDDVAQVAMTFIVRARGLEGVAAASAEELVDARRAYIDAAILALRDLDDR